MHNVFITTYQGLEEILFNELVELGIKKQRIKAIKRGVSVQGCSLKEVYKFNYELRTALRVLINLSHFRLRSPKDLHWKSKQINWHHWFEPHQSFKVDAAVNNSKEFNNSKFAAQLVKDGVVDCFKNTRGERPDVDIRNPEIKIHVLVSKDNVTISIDSSGESLHKRGYKTGSFRAPLSEVLAAGIVLQLNLESNSNLYDPMCGSGTLLTEAYLHLSNIAPGKWRQNWAFENWSNFDEDLLLNVKEEASNLEVPFKGNLIAGDQYRANVEMTENNLKRLGCFKGLYKTGDFFRSTKPYESGIMIMNPPYDQRIELEESKEFYKEIGDTFKQEYSGWKAGVFSANIPALKALGLKPSKRIPLFNGPLEGRLNLFDMY